MIEKITSISLLKQLLLGKSIKHYNSHSREVVLEVEDVSRKHHSTQITPDTKENDWYGQSADWDTIKITFVDGSNIEVGLDTELKIV